METQRIVDGKVCIQCILARRAWLEVEISDTCTVSRLRCNFSVETKYRCVPRSATTSLATQEQADAVRQLVLVSLLRAVGGGSTYLVALRLK